MALSTKSKAKLGAKTAKTAAKHPRVTKALAKGTFKAGKPVAKRKVRRHAKRVGRSADRVGAAAGRVGATVRTVGTTARAAGQWIVVFGPIVAQAAGLVEPPPKRRHTGLRVLAGVVLGATAMYFLRGGDRRQGRKPVP
jgi:hypothetical protein